MISEEWLRENELHKNPFAFEELEMRMKNSLRMGGWKIDPIVGLYHTEKDIRACPVPVLPVALYKSADGGCEKVELKFWDMGRWESIIVPRDMIASRSKITELSNRGIEVSSENAGKLVKALNGIIGESRDLIPRFTYCSHLGWHSDDFVPYSGMVLFDADGDYKSIAGCIDQKGSLEEWTAFMAPLIKNTKFRLAMAASFASPLIELVGQLPFILHLWGKSGSGKTVTAMCCASIWGDPNPGRYLKSLNMTVNALLTTASVLNNLPFIGDELQTIRTTGESYDKLIMTACEGINRGRMNRSKMEETLSWKNSFIFTGEEPLTGNSSGAGAVNRVIQVECSAELIPNGNETANFVRTHFGEAGKAYVNALDRDTVKQYYENYAYALKAQADKDSFKVTDKQLNAMALLLTADAISGIQFFPDTWKSMEAEDIFPYFTDPKDVDISERAYEYICNIISANSQAFTHEAREAWGIIKGEKVFINNVILERELLKGGFRLNAVKRPWVENGYMLFNDKENRYRFMTNIWGSNASCSCLIVPVSSDDIRDIP